MGDRRQVHLFAFDKKATSGFEGWMAGVDEAGRGPLAGPVVAAAVILFRRSEFKGLNDSKKVTPQRREELFREIARHSLIGIGVVGERQIDEVNIYQASRLAMKQAVLSLTRTPDFLLIDGKYMKVDVPLPQRSVIAGDEKSASIAAASIIAKVYRDSWMKHLDSLYPSYGFRNHKGYPTEDHIKQIQSNGITPVHRRTFGPVQEALEKDAKRGSSEN